MLGESQMSGEKISDVVVHRTSPRIDPSKKPVKERFDLSSDLRIDRLPKGLADKIFEACEPPGFRFNPVRQFGQLYSFIRDTPPNTNDLQWDTDQRLQRCLALSRIVHPTSISFEFAARIFASEDGEISKIVPGPVSGSGAQAFVVDPKFNYLTDADASDLKELIQAFERKPLQDPIARAMWYHEYAARSCEIDVRWTFIATGIEVLIHKNRHKSTKQFVERVKRLSVEVGANLVTEDEAEKMYELRSALSHGQGLSGLTPLKMQLYQKMENILRLTIRKSIVDQAFDDFLSDPDNIRRRWPV